MAYGFDKTEHAFKEYNKDLREGNLSNVLLFYGEEDYLISWAIDSLVNKYTEKDSIDFDLVKLDEESTVSDILEVADTFSMFSSKKVVVVKDFLPLKNQNAKGYTENDKDDLLNYLDNPNDDTILIFSSNEINPKLVFTKEFLKAVKSYNFCKLDPPELRGFIEKRFKANQVEISRSQVQLIIDETGYLHKDTSYRIFNLENDIKKIIAVGDGKSVKDEDIITTLSGDMDTFVFNFINAVSSNKKALSFELLENILNEGNEIFSVLGLLVNNFELLLMVSEFNKDRGMSQSQIANQLKIQEFRVKNALNSVKQLKTERIKEILSQLYEIDRNIKSGDLSDRLALELLVARI